MCKRNLHTNRRNEMILRKIETIKNKYFRAGALLSVMIGVGAVFGVITHALTAVNPLLNLAFVLACIYALIVWVIGD